MSSERRYLIGTRGSALALWQANLAASLICARTELRIIKTGGDKFQDIPLQRQQEKGFFSKEIEDSLLQGEIDIAVHSLKDLPTCCPTGLTYAAYLARAPANDLLLIRPAAGDEDRVFPVKAGAVVGAGSLRRQALLATFGPHVNPAMIRGNVPTRLQKCLDGQYDCLILAQAGISRLAANISDFLVYRLNPLFWIPAPGQGVILVQARADDAETLALLRALNDPASERAALIERKLLANFEGGCHTAFAAYAVPSTPTEWEVHLGMDWPGRGWRWCSITGTNEYCTAFGVNKLPEFYDPRIPKYQSDLCLPFEGTELRNGY